MSNQLRWGILGTGNIAKQFAVGVRSAKRSCVTAVASRSGATAKEFAEKYSLATALASYAELLKRDDVDAIYLSLPNNLHHEWTIRSLEAGKHVLCEKPFAMNEHEAREMFDVARKYKRVLMEAFMYRCHPLTHAVQRELLNGTIGKIKTIRTSFCYRSQKIDGNVRFDRKLGGGGLMDVGCYCLNFARMIAEAEPMSIHASAHFHERGVDDVCAGMLVFPNQLLATFICGMTLQADNTAMICGDEGYIEVPIPWKPPVNGATYVVGRGIPPRQDGGAKSPPINPREAKTVNAGMELYGLEADHFARAVLDGEELAVSEADTVGNMRCIDEIRRQIGLEF